MLKARANLVGRSNWQVIDELLTAYEDTKPLFHLTFGAQKSQM